MDTAGMQSILCILERQPIKASTEAKIRNIGIRGLR